MTKHVVRLASIAVLIVPRCLFATASQEYRATDISFIDELQGWVSATEPIPSILRTTDGGKTWVQMPVPLKGGGFYPICFHDANVGLAVQSPSDEEISIYRTENSGQNWTRVNTIRERYLHITALKFIADDEVLLTGEGSGGIGWVAHLSNRGRTLHVLHDLPVDFTAQSNTLDIFGDGTGHIWIVGRELLLHSADNGKHWVNQYRNTAPRMAMGVAGTALPGGRAWVVEWGKIYRTLDYGKHWMRALTAPWVSFDSIAFSNPDHGCAVTRSAFIYCTNDGGKTWARDRLFRGYLNGSPQRSKLYLFHSVSGPV